MVITGGAVGRGGLVCRLLSSTVLLAATLVDARAPSFRGVAIHGKEQDKQVRRPGKEEKREVRQCCD